MVSALVDYLEAIEDLPVGPSVPPGWLLEHLPEHPPEVPEDFGDVLEDLSEVIRPALVNWQAPGFHGYFPANTSWPAAFADFVAAGLGQQAMVWATSPAATELEMRMLDWVVELCGLPEHFAHAAPGPGGGVIQDSASSGTLVALLAARERAGGRDELARQVVYHSLEAHSSVIKGARIAGFAEKHIRAVATDDALAMRPDVLADLIAEDLAAGRVPAGVVATVGTTSTMALDPVAEIAAVLDAVSPRDDGSGPRPWLHVDAAMAGGATICEEHRGLLDGVDRADSYLFNPHKWWGVTFDCTTMWVADRAPVLDALAIMAPYLRNESSENDSVVDFRDWQVPLGRRFRALKIWFVLRAIGAGAIAGMVRDHCAEADWLAAQVGASSHWELAAPPLLNLVCVRHRDGERATREVARRLNDSGRALVTVTEVDGSAVLRLSLGSPSVTHEDVARLWALVDASPS
ncbi:MAG: aspartate aminotransferase family protein [Microthrixaceae bacterium]|nr:aspartate aminotransferase family protein [Microthrixaceae bacterium]